MGMPASERGGMPCPTRSRPSAGASRVAISPGQLYAYGICRRSASDAGPHGYFVRSGPALLGRAKRVAVRRSWDARTISAQLAYLPNRARASIRPSGFVRACRRPWRFQQGVDPVMRLRLLPGLARVFVLPSGACRGHPQGPLRPEHPALRMLFRSTSAGLHAPVPGHRQMVNLG